MSKLTNALLAGITAASSPVDSNATAVATPRFKGIILPSKEWQRRKKRLSMQKQSRKANRK